MVNGGLPVEKEFSVSTGTLTCALVEEIHSICNLYSIKLFFDQSFQKHFFFKKKKFSKEIY